MDYRKTDGVLSIENKDGVGTIMVEGTKSAILNNFVALTHIICEDTGIPVERLAAGLPEAVRSYRKTQAFAICIQPPPRKGPEA